MSARVSIRVSIAWSGHPAIEDTDTLVLTIGSYSLDLRVFNDNAGPDKGTIDWSTVARVGEIEGSTKDQGVFDTLPNGDVTETGIMHNPKTDRYEPYVETWRRLNLGSGADIPYLVLERQKKKETNASAESGTNTGEHEHEEGVFIGRVGGYALGLAKVDGVYHAWRDSLSENGWERVYEFSNYKECLRELLPTLPVSVPEGWTEGATVKLGESEWIVRAAGTV
ncbi:hypothetical protein I317_05750 [Kwoniella heveanensis CBS 569]|nr:hypothetical protein I317_05750 [Kwoniella heveanensis CBS 569]